MAEFRGIDVSAHNGGVDFNKVKAAEYSFAILRAGWCGHDGLIVRGKGYDARFDLNIQNALAAGLDVGVYVYSYARTPEAAKTAARQVLAMVGPHKLTMPIMWDFEDAGMYAVKALNGKPAPSTAAQNVAICKAFLGEIERAGYYAMLYTYTSFADNYLDMKALSAHDLWIADYRGYVGYKGPYGIWQHSSGGSVPGVSSARCDLNIAYRDYPAIIKAAGLNGLGAPPAPAPAPEPEEPQPPADHAACAARERELQSAAAQMARDNGELRAQLAAAQAEIAALGDKLQSAREMLTI